MKKIGPIRRVGPFTAALLVSALLSWTSAVLGADTTRVNLPKQPRPTKAPQVIVLGEDTPQALMLNGDSIYAVQISIDNEGIHVVTREGKTLTLLRLQGDVDGLPDLPYPDELDDGGVLAPGGMEAGTQDQIVRLLGNVHVQPDEVVRGDVICIFCDIQLDGRATGSAVSVFGNVTVNGRTGGEVVAPFGRVIVGSEGYVRGDVVASQLEREPGGRIHGSRHEILFNIFGEEGPGNLWTRQAFTVIVVLKILFWLFLVLLAHALAARNIGKIKARIQSSYVKSFLFGILGQILLLPVWLLLIVTIIGIPVAIFAMPLLLFAGLILAQAAVGQLVGDKIAENTALPLRSNLSRTMAGVAALQIFAYLSILFIWPSSHGTVGGAFRMATVAMIALSAITGYVVITLGTGAVLLTRFGTRPKDPVPEVTASPEGIESGATPLPYEARRPDESGTAPAPST